MKKFILLIPIIFLIISCGKDSLTSDKLELNSNSEVNHRHIDVDPESDCELSFPCVEIDTLEVNAEGCCYYRICLPFPGRGKLLDYDYHLQVRNGTVTSLLGCYLIEVCDRATVTISKTGSDCPLCPIVSTLECEFDLVCGSEQCCPIVAEYSHGFDENHPEFSDCCVFNYELTQDPPPGCEWVVETGPNGVSAPWGIARICPGETLDLKLDCGDGELKEVCSLDLECAATSCCDELCYDIEISNRTLKCFDFTVTFEGDCLSNPFANYVVSKGFGMLSLVDKTASGATFRYCGQPYGEEIMIILETLECGSFNVGPVNPLDPEGAPNYCG